MPDALGSSEVVTKHPISACNGLPICHQHARQQEKGLTAPGGAGATPGESARPPPPSELRRLCAPVAELLLSVEEAGVTGAAPALPRLPDGPAATGAASAALYKVLCACGPAAAAALSDALGLCRTPAGIGSISSHNSWNTVEAIKFLESLTCQASVLMHQSRWHNMDCAMLASHHPYEKHITLYRGRISCQVTDLG